MSDMPGEDGADPPTPEVIAATVATLNAAQEQWPHFTLRASAASPFGGFLQNRLWDVCLQHDAYSSVGLQSRACEQLQAIQALDQECLAAMEKLAELLGRAARDGTTMKAVASVVLANPGLADATMLATTPPSLQRWLSACERCFTDGSIDVSRATLTLISDTTEMQPAERTVFQILRVLAGEATRCDFTL